jgi:hypothetical protein
MTVHSLAEELGTEAPALIKKARKAGLRIVSDPNAELTPERESFLRHIAHPQRSTQGIRSRSARPL